MAGVKPIHQVPAFSRWGKDLKINMMNMLNARDTGTRHSFLIPVTAKGETRNMKLETARRMNLVNVGEHVENAKFTTYRYETKGSGERGERCAEVFWLPRT